MSFIETVLTFSLGSIIYGLIEILYRGWTHWAMLICGGICFVLLYLISNYTNEAKWKKWVMGAFIITTVEFLFGIFFNIKLNYHIWDYSHHAIQLMGQISMTFSFYWFLLSIPGVGLCQLINRKFFNFLQKDKRNDLL